MIINIAEKNPVEYKGAFVEFEGEECVTYDSIADNWKTSCIGGAAHVLSCSSCIAQR